MEGKIFLIRVADKKIVPALCLGKRLNDFLFAQIRKANQSDYINPQEREKMEKYNNDKAEKDQMRIREKNNTDSIYINKPNGLNTKSVVMVKKLYQVKKQDILKEISHVPQRIVTRCNDLIQQVDEVMKLQKELQSLKKKIELAQINNEKYTQYEIRIDQILKELGYPRIKKGKKKPYNNYREVPNKGYIRIYHGGR